MVNVTAAGGSTIVNDATIDSDETPPTTQSETTYVIATITSALFKGKGDGKQIFGSSGPMELLFMLLVLPVLRAHHIGRGVSSLLMTVALIAVLTVSVTSTSLAADQGWYAGAGAGLANTDTGASNYDNDLANKGFTASSNIGDTDAGWKIYGGYQLDRNWAIEATYVDQGDVTSKTTVSAPPLPTAVEQQQFVESGSFRPPTPPPQAEIPATSTSTS